MIQAVFFLFDQDGVGFLSVEEIQEVLQVISRDCVGVYYLAVSVQTYLTVDRDVAVEAYREDFWEVLELEHVASGCKNAADSLGLKGFNCIPGALGNGFRLVRIEGVVEVEEDGLNHD